jgi:glycosyl transferase family 2
MKRLRHLASFVGSEISALRRERVAGGMEYAVSARLGHHVGIEPVRSRVDGLAAQLHSLLARIGAVEEVANPLDARIGQRQARADELAATVARVAALEGRCADLGVTTVQLGAATAELDRRTGGQEACLARLERAESVAAVMAWIEQAPLSTSPLVSVILPTRNRPAQLPRALESVIAQTYGHWELVVVDDGGDDGTAAAVVASFAEPRIHYHRIDHRGVCGARNHGLAQARGDLIAYLDDDNTMHPGWLKAVVWGFEYHPEADAAYGAFVIDDWTRINGPGDGSFPTMFFHPYSREALLRANLADISAIAHRAGLAEAWFDEGLREMGDWDLLVRITAHHEPLRLPAIACFYTTDAPNRLSGGPTFYSDWAELWRRNGIDDQVPSP